MKTYNRSEILKLVKTLKIAGVSTDKLARAIDVSTATASKILNESVNGRRPRNLTCYAIEQFIHRECKTTKTPIHAEPVELREIPNTVEGLQAEVVRLRKTAKAYEMLASTL
tara:strand:- start:816 stop:1151 length:336 start_codon:yes stop_codon:yes gene_type:complete